jgi:hypothetical protein
MTKVERTDIKHPASFKDGVRVLLLMLRAKDGGSAKTDRKAVKKVVTQSPAEFDEALSELRSRWQSDERIYSTINERSLSKAQRLFNFRLLEANYFAPADRDSFYLDLENRWVSCLKDGKASTESLFLFDFDNDLLDKSKLFADFHIPTSHYEVLDTYATRNGHHVITTPFNPDVIPAAVRAIRMQNALMLWSY